MILIYYRRGGQIVRHHTVRDGETLHTLYPLVEEYNSKHETEKAYIRDLPEDGLEAYLWECSRKKKLFTEETVRAARDAIREALDAIDCLEVAK